LTVDAGALFNANGQNIDFLYGGGLTVNGTFEWQGGESLSNKTAALGANSTVVYDGAASPVTVKNWSYKNLTLTAPGKELDWTAGGTYAVASNFTARGAVGNPIVLRSTSPGDFWTLNISGATTDVSRVDVMDSHASNGTITALFSYDRGNNVNWIFPPWSNPSLLIQLR
jgi:hypothetical protein